MYSSAYPLCWPPPKKCYYIVLCTKNREVIQFHLIFWMELDLPLKSFHFSPSISSIKCRLILFSITFCISYIPPLLIQQLSKSAFMVWHCPILPSQEKIKKNAQIWDVTSQWRNKCLLVSAASIHKEHLDVIWSFVLWSASWVRHAFFATSHEKHFTFVGAMVFQIVFPGTLNLPVISDKPLLYTLFTVKCPSSLCLHLMESGAVVIPVKFPILFSSSTTVSTSQSFNNLLQIRFHPCADQVSSIVVSGLAQIEKSWFLVTKQWLCSLFLDV